MDGTGLLYQFIEVLPPNTVNLLLSFLHPLLGMLAIRV